MCWTPRSGRFERPPASMMARAIGLYENYEAAKLRAKGTGRVQVFILAPQPRSFAVQGGGSSLEEGYVVYHYVFYRDQE